MLKTGTENCRLHGGLSTPIVSSRVLEEDVASPAELAKAYMGSRPSKATTPMLALRSQAPREDATLLNSIQFSPKSSIMSLAPKSALRLGVTENGFITPRSRGRSAIYNMARTPYSRVYSTANQKGVKSISDGFGEPSSSSQYAWEQDGYVGSKQVAHKRRSSVLDNDIGSVGPIRRIRQKTNLLYPRNLSIPVSGGPVGVSSDTAERPSWSTKKLLLLDEPNHKVSTMLGEYGDNSVRSTSFTHVPSKSTEMATKILQQLEKLSPKEKSSEARLAAERDKSPTKLKPSGKAFRSPEDVDASRFLQNAKDGRKLEDSHTTSLPDARDSSSQKQDKIEENDPKALRIPSDMLTPAVNSVDATVLVKDAVPSFKNTGPATANFVALPPQKKRAFQMSAHEDSLELDYDVHSNGGTSRPLKGREKLKTSVVESEAVGTETEAADKISASCEFKPPAGSEFSQRTGLETNNGSVAGEKSFVYTFPPTVAPSSTLQQTLLTPQLTSGVDKIVPLKEASVPPPLVSFGSKNVDKVPPFEIPFSSPASESSDLKYSALLDPKPEGSNGFLNVASGATDAVSETSEAENFDDKNTRNAGDLTGKSGKVFSSALSNSSSTSSIFSFGAPANNSWLNNGLLASSPSIFSSAAPVQNFTSSTTTVVMNSTSIAATTTASSSSLTSSAAAPSFSATPIFGSVAPSTSIAAVSTSCVQNINLKANTEDTAFANLTSSPFGTTSNAISPGSSIFGFSAPATFSTAKNQPQGSPFGNGDGSLGGAQASSGGTSSAMTLTSTGSSIFGFSAPATSSTAKNLPLDSPFGNGNRSLGGAQASSAGTGVATATQTMPVQFGSSAPSPVFGSTGPTTFTSSTLFSSSSSAAKLFSSGNSFGLSSAATSSEASSSSGATSSLFGSGWQPIKSPIFGASSSNSLYNPPPPSTGFPFGASPASVAATDTAPSMAFGSSIGASSGSIFSFTTAASNTSFLTSFSQTQPVFGNNSSVFTAVSGNSDQMNMEDSMSEDPVQASTPAVPVFGQPPVSPPSGLVFGSSTPSATPPFPFGGQQNQATPQSPAQFQASGSLDFSAGGSFSLGTGDKSNRRMVRVKRNPRKK
ncbi:nuclear pore complex protein NUP1 isoform X2 [Cornus florida]|nr:nuclear pore complex protein NUP1 isoform X2 [Cornus florida]